MPFNAIRENKILAKISEFTVVEDSDQKLDLYTHWIAVEAHL